MAIDVANRLVNGLESGQNVASLTEQDRVVRVSLDESQIGQKAVDVGKESDVHQNRKENITRGPFMQKQAW